MPSVNLKGLQPQMVLAIFVANDAYGCQGRDCIITSAVRNGTFEEHGFHAVGQAIDLSVRSLRGEMIPDDEMSVILAQLQAVLGRPGGGQYDVVDERKVGSSAGWTGTHIHIEFDPK